MLHGYNRKLHPMNSDKQKRNSKGKFLKVNKPKKHIIRVTNEEKKMIEEKRQKKGVNEQ